MFKEFQCPENIEKVLCVYYFLPDHPKIIKGLMVDFSCKTIKFEQQMEFQSFKIIQDFKKALHTAFFA